VVDAPTPKYGLDVTIRPGARNRMADCADPGKIEFFMGGDMLGYFLSPSRISRPSRWPPISRKILKSSCRIRASGLDKWTDLPRRPFSPARGR